MATTKIDRIYKGKDVDMLVACSSILEHATTHKTALVVERPTWADPFIPNLKNRIDTAVSTYLGVDNAKQLREATQALTAIQKNAMKDLAKFKVQIMEDFKKNKTRRDEILIQLGFTEHLEDVQNKDQEALIELLYKFKQNMTATLQTEITTAGMSASSITTIIGYATTLKSADISQETFKGTRPEISQSAVKEFNEIYSSVISVAKISAKIFKTNKAVQDKFSYSKTLNNLNQLKDKPDKGGSPPPVA